MLTITARKKAASVKEYHALQEKTEGREAVSPIWAGLGAIRLGLQGIVDRLSFNRLLDNRTPDGKGKLKPRDRSDGIAIQDFTFSAPKGVSLAAEFTPAGDAIREAHIQSVKEALEEHAEPFAATRVRMGGKDEDRHTGEMTLALFTHLVGRAASANAIPSPQLHTHAAALNHTWDAAEGKHKALKAEPVYRNAGAIKRAYHQKLRSRVEAMGFRTRDHGKFWDLADVPNATVRKFSDRRSAIEKLYSSVKEVTPRLRQKSGIMTRSPKQDIINLDQLRKDWFSRLTEREISVFAGLQAKPKVNRPIARRKAHVARMLSRHYDGPSKERDHGITLE